MEPNSGLERQPEKLSLDSLYDSELASLECQELVYQQILSRVHKRIRLASRNWKNGRYCFYLIPEMVIGIPRYNVTDCTKYLITTLRKNGFIVSYTYPNLLFVSWEHYLHVKEREKIKQATGKRVNGFGEVIQPKGTKPEGGGDNSTKRDPPKNVYDIDMLFSSKKHL